MRVFIMCPAEIATGGTELLHQFSYMLSGFGVENYMVYLDRKEEVCPTAERFLKYNVKYVSSYVDDAESLLVLPETEVEHIDICKKGKVAIWWLSVDNYVGSYVKKGDSYDCFGLKERKNVLHFVQSFYAEMFLKQILKINEVYYLTDYINEEIIDISEKINNRYGSRKNYVLFNPRKGFDRIKPILEKCRKDIKWIPLINMTPCEMAQMMLLSKVYIDFGHHPGKDRIPREAAICGCCVLTNQLGSARFYQDISVPDKYKIEDMSKHELVLDKIYDLIDNYDERVADFEVYRNKIHNEKANFKKEVVEFIEIVSANTMEGKRKTECNASLELIFEAITNMQDLVEKIYATNDLIDKDEVIGNMLEMDYIIQLVRETIYAQLMNMDDR